MNPKERERRFTILRQLGCIACRIYGCPDCGMPEIHHQNLGDHAGQKRLGDEFTIPLGAWHHRGDPPPGMTAKRAEEVHGPSFARSSKRFREVFGTAEMILALTNVYVDARVRQNRMLQ